jgi:hypothetical protein
MYGFHKRLTIEAKSELEKVWDKIYRETVSTCPFDTGTLVGTIKMATGSKAGEQMDTSSSGLNKTIFNGTIVVGDDAVLHPNTGIPTSWYAIWVHDGSIYVDGRPFLTEAFLKYEQELEDAIKNAIDKSNASKTKVGGP